MWINAFVQFLLWNTHHILGAMQVPLILMHQYFIGLTHLLYHLQRRQVAGEDEGWSCAGEHILDVLLEMQKERERKDEVAM